MSRSTVRPLKRSTEDQLGQSSGRSRVNQRYVLCASISHASSSNHSSHGCHPAKFSKIDKVVGYLGSLRAILMSPRAYPADPIQKAH